MIYAQVVANHQNMHLNSDFWSLLPEKGPFWPFFRHFSDFDVKNTKTCICIVTFEAFCPKKALFGHFLGIFLTLT